MEAHLSSSHPSTSSDPCPTLGVRFPFPNPERPREALSDRIRGVKDPYYFDAVEKCCFIASRVAADANSPDIMLRLKSVVKDGTLERSPKLIDDALKKWKAAVEQRDKPGAAAAFFLLQGTFEEYRELITGSSAQLRSMDLLDMVFKEIEHRVCFSMILASVDSERRRQTSVPDWPEGFRQPTMTRLLAWLKVPTGRIHWISDDVGSRQRTVLHQYTRLLHTSLQTNQEGPQPMFAAINFTADFDEFEDQFVTTIVWQLVERCPNLKEEIANYAGAHNIQNQTSELWKFLERQITNLLVKPYRFATNNETTVCIFLDDIHLCSRRIMALVFNFIETTIAGGLPVLYIVGSNGELETCRRRVARRQDPGHLHREIWRRIDWNPVEDGGVSAPQMSPEIRPSATLESPLNDPTRGPGTETRRLHWEFGANPGGHHLQKSVHQPPTWPNAPGPLSREARGSSIRVPDGGAATATDIQGFEYGTLSRSSATSTLIQPSTSGANAIYQTSIIASSSSSVAYQTSKYALQYSSSHGLVDGRANSHNREDVSASTTHGEGDSGTTPHGAGATVPYGPRRTSESRNPVPNLQPSSTRVARQNITEPGLQLFPNADHWEVQDIAITTQNVNSTVTRHVGATWNAQQATIHINHNYPPTQPQTRPRYP